MQETVAVAVTESSQVGDARRRATALAHALGFDETGCGRVAIVVSEAATNLVKHGDRGLVLLHAIADARANGLEILVLDRGPGMTDLAGCLRDGFSSTGTSGTGLGAIDRLSAFMDVYTRPPKGTALLIRFWTEAAISRPPASLDVGAVCVPLSGEEICGDCWAVLEQGRRSRLLVADGLGHGPLAANASREVLRSARAHVGSSLVTILENAHTAVRSTRGAAVAVAEVDLDAELVRYAGVGNIAGLVVTDGPARSLLSHTGTVGHLAPRMQEFSYPFPKGALLVMCSDGLTSSVGLDAYPGLACHDATLVAAVLFRDFQRGRDDATVVVARAAEGGRA